MYQSPIKTGGKASIYLNIEGGGEYDDEEEKIPRAESELPSRVENFRDSYVQETPVAR